MKNLKSKLGSKLGIVTTIAVLALILVAIGNKETIKDSIKNKTLPVLDSEFVSFYKKACELKDAEACNELGLIYDHGKAGESVDYEYAYTYYGLACNLDNGSACNNLAYLYNHGKGVEKHNGYAFRYYKKACDLGELEGCYNLGAMYYRGEGVRASKYRAAKIFSEVCDKGIGAGCNDLAYMYAHGIHLRKDIFEAISLYSDACQYGEASGCNNLGNLYESGDLGVAKDSVKAERFFIKGCELDDSESCNKLGYLYGKGIQQIQSKEDFKLASRACNKYNNSVSCYKLGELFYSENKLVEQDVYKAISFFEKACDMGQSQSCKRLGDIHREQQNK